MTLRFSNTSQCDMKKIYSWKLRQYVQLILAFVKLSLRNNVESSYEYK